MSFTKAPLEKRRAIFFQTGLIAALALALAAFTYTTPEYGYKRNLSDLAHGEVLIDPTPISPIPKPPAPPQTPVVNNQLPINLVDELPEPSTDPVEPITFTLEPLSGDIDNWGDDDREGEATLTFDPLDPTAVQRAARCKNCEGGTALDELQCTQLCLKSQVQNLAKYPTLEREAGIEGHATILFVINEQGEVVNAEVKRCSGKRFGEEALAAVNKLPPLLPAMHLGKPRSVYMQIPVTFKIR